MIGGIIYWEREPWKRTTFEGEDGDVDYKLRYEYVKNVFMTDKLRDQLRQLDI